MVDGVVIPGGNGMWVKAVRNGEDGRGGYTYFVDAAQPNDPGAAFWDFDTLAPISLTTPEGDSFTVTRKRL